MNRENGSRWSAADAPVLIGSWPASYLPDRTLAAMHETDVSFHGEVWTDARGQATVSLPRDAYAPEAELEYALHPINGESGVRLTAALRDGRFTIATDEPHVKVAWLISRREEKSK